MFPDHISTFFFTFEGVCGRTGVLGVAEWDRAEGVESQVFHSAAAFGFFTLGNINFLLELLLIVPGNYTNSLPKSEYMYLYFIA